MQDENDTAQDKEEDESHKNQEPDQDDTAKAEEEADDEDEENANEESHNTKKTQPSIFVNAPGPPNKVYYEIVAPQNRARCANPIPWGDGERLWCAEHHKWRAPCFMLARSPTAERKE